MPQAEDEFEAKQIVRVYSVHAEDRLPPPNPANDLARVLSSREKSLEDALEPWRRFYEPWEPEDAKQNPITAVLTEQAGNLQKQWLEFQQLSPKEERVDTRSTEPTIQGLIDMVASVSKSWKMDRGKGNRGKVMRHFHNLCGTLDAHSNMLGIVPKGNEYVSLFAGTLTSIVKASVNHESIVEDLAEALVIISETVADCEIELSLFKTEAMMSAVADLYAHIFMFLVGFMRWHLKKRRRRMLDSFNEKFFEQFSDEIDNIRNKSATIQRKASQSANAEQRSIRLTVERTARNVDRLHDRLTRLLVEVTQAHEMHMQPTKTLLLRSRQVSNAGSITMLKASQTVITREELALNAARLDTLFPRDRVQLPCSHFISTNVDPQALAQVAEWTVSPNPHILSIVGPYSECDELEDRTSMLAAKFTEYAASSHVPVVSYFCALNRGRTADGSETREMCALMEMLYALIRQLINHVDEQIESSLDFSAEIFVALDLTSKSWYDAIALLEEIISLLPERVFCVIDGMQWLDDRSTIEYTSHFLQVIRNDKLKILFTTSGPCRGLLDGLKRDEMWFCDEKEWKESSERCEFDVDLEIRESERI